MREPSREEIAKELNLIKMYLVKHDRPGYAEVLEKAISFLESSAQEPSKMYGAYVADKVVELFVVLNIHKPSPNDVQNAKTFIQGRLQDGAMFGRKEPSEAELGEFVENKGKDIVRWFHRWREQHTELLPHTAKNIIRNLLKEAPMRKPKVSKKRIIEFQNLLLDVSKKETGVILAMARITGWLIEAGFEVEK